MVITTKLLPLATILLICLHTTSATPKTCWSCFDGKNSDIHGSLLKYFVAQHPLQTLLPYGDVICRKPRSIQCTDSCVGIKVTKNDTILGASTTYFMGCSEHFDPVPDTPSELKCTIRNEDLGYNKHVSIEYCTCGTPRCNDPKKSLPSSIVAETSKKFDLIIDPPKPKAIEVVNSASSVVFGGVFLLTLLF